MNELVYTYPSYESLQFAAGYSAIWSKLEFVQLLFPTTLPDSDWFPHQLFIKRWMNPHTPYDRLLIAHEMGSGKTCSAFNIALSGLPSKNIRHVFFLATSRNVLVNAEIDFVERCSKNQAEKYRKNISYTTIEVFIRDLTNKYGRELDRTVDTLLDQFQNTLIIVDEAHTITDQEYTIFHILFHTIIQAKVVFMTATPIVDQPTEIIKLMNLLLPLDRQLTLTAADVDINEFRTKCMGYISYYASPPETNIVREIIEHNTPSTLTLSRAFTLSMVPGGIQDTHYMKISLDTSAIFKDAHQSSLFVFPDGTFGEVGRKLFCGDDFRKMRPFVEKYIRPRQTSLETALDNLALYSIKYKFIIQNILEHPRQGHLVYMDAVKGGGAELFTQLLTAAFGMTADINDTNKPRVGLLTGSITPAQAKHWIALANSPENSEGKLVRVLVLTRAFSLGINLRFMRDIYLATYHWNISVIEQTIARVRPTLTDTGEFHVRIYPLIAIPSDNNFEESYDYHQYKLAEDKDKRRAPIMRAIKEISIDCILNSKVYAPDDGNSNRDGTRACDYEPCTVKCIADRDPDHIDSNSYLNLYSLNDEHIELVREYFTTHWGGTLDTFVELFDVMIESAAQMILDKCIYARLLFQSPNKSHLYLSTLHDYYYLSELPHQPLEEQVYAQWPMSRVGSPVSIESEYTRSSADYGSLIDKYLETPHRELRQKLTPVDQQVVLEIFTTLNARNSLPARASEEFSWMTRHWLQEMVLGAAVSYLVSKIPSIPPRGIKDVDITTGIWHTLDDTELSQLVHTTTTDTISNNPYRFYGFYGILDVDSRGNEVFKLAQLTSDTTMGKRGKRKVGQVITTMKTPDLIQYAERAGLSPPSGKWTKSQVISALKDILTQNNLVISAGAS